MNTDQANAQWSLEIETVVVAVLWHQPQRMPEFMRVIDPHVHLTQPHLQILLEAIQIGYADLGCANWETVIQVVRELGQLEALGGLQTLNTIWETGRDFLVAFVTEPPAEARARHDLLFNDHVRSLQEFAIGRAEAPARRVARFSGGKATLYLNKAKRSQRDPDYLGEARARGHRYLMRGYLGADQESVNITLDPA